MSIEMAGGRPIRRDCSGYAVIPNRRRRDHCYYQQKYDLTNCEKRKNYVSLRTRNNARRSITSNSALCFIPAVNSSSCSGLELAKNLLSQQLLGDVSLKLHCLCN